jgi:hypothetical protein
MRQTTGYIQRFAPFLQLFICLSMAFTFLVGCSSGLKMTSDRRQDNIIVDGNDAEWQNGLYYDKESDLVYGVRNDDEYIYVFLKTQNRMTQRQILRGGFTVWFDKEGGKKHTFGIRYPLGEQGRPQEIRPDADEEQMHAMLDQVFGELEILGPQGEDVQRFPTMDARGVRVKIGRTRDALVYELCVPLTKTSNHPFAIDQISTSRLGVGFETSEFNRGEMKSGPQMNSGFGEAGPLERTGMGGEEQEGRGHGGSHRGGSPEGTGRTRQMTLWLAVQLAR